MSSQDSWLEAAKKFNVDFEALIEAYPETTERFKSVFEDLKEVQQLHKEFYGLDYKTKLSATTIEALDREAQQYRQAIRDLIKLLEEPKRPASEARRIINEASVRKREMKFYASQYLPYLLLKEEKEDFKSQEGIAEAGEIFRKYLRDADSKDKKSKNFWHRLTYKGDVYPEQASRWLAWRSVWLTLVFIAYVGIICVLVATYFKWGFIPNGVEINDFGDIIALKLLLLPFVTIPIIGFIFTNRNYRIYSHLSELYTHRDASIKLLLAIMNNKAFSQQWTDSKERLAVINEASMMLFKYRPSGHLRSKESDGSIISRMTIPKE